MKEIHSSCDRHSNLQMVPYAQKRGAGQTEVHICPVPGCGRGHDGRQYFDASEAEVFARLKGQTNRREAARAAILKTIEERRVTGRDKGL
jgi:hypothetical protein